MYLLTVKRYQRLFFFPNSHVRNNLQDFTYSKGEPSFRRICQTGGPRDLAHEPKGLSGKGKVIF